MKRAYSVLTLKAADGADGKRIFTGIASTPSTDRSGDVVVPEGAKFTLPIPLLWQHDSKQPIGWITAATVTKNGIEVVGEIHSMDEPGALKNRLDLAWQSIKSTLVRGLSIGFNPIDWEKIEGTWGLKYTSWEWLELSAVTIAANQDATITSVKAASTESRAALGLHRSVVVRHAKYSGATEQKPTKLKGSIMTLAEQIAQFLQTRAEKAEKQSAIMTKAHADGNRTLDEDEALEHDTITNEIKAIDDHLTRLRAMETSQVKTAVPVPVVNATATASEARGSLPVVKNTQKLEKGIEFAQWVICLGASKGNLMQAEQMAKSRYPDNEALNLSIKAAVAAGTTTDPTWAAPLVDTYQRFAGDFVEFLRPQTIIGRFGTDGIPSLRRVPFNISIAGQTSGGNGYWVGEGNPKPLTKFDYADITLRWAKVANIAVLTEELLRFSNPAAEGLVRQSLADALIARLDIDFILPSKAEVTNVSPASITNGVTQIPSTGNTADDVRADVQALFGTYIAANMSPRNGVWIMSATRALALSMMMNPLGQSEFPGITMNGGTFQGLPVIVSEYVPTDSGGSLVILANASDILLADDGQVVVDASREASLQMLDNPTNDTNTPTATTMVSMFQTNSVALRAERWINWKKRRPQAVAVLSGVNWGKVA